MDTAAVCILGERGCAPHGIGMGIARCAARVGVVSDGAPVRRHVDISAGWGVGPLSDTMLCYALRGPSDLTGRAWLYGECPLGDALPKTPSSNPPTLPTHIHRFLCVMFRYVMLEALHIQVAEEHIQRPIGRRPVELRGWWRECFNGVFENGQVLVCAIERPDVTACLPPSSSDGGGSVVHPTRAPQRPPDGAASRHGPRLRGLRGTPGQPPSPASVLRRRGGATFRTCDATLKRPAAGGMVLQTHPRGGERQQRRGAFVN